MPASSPIGLAARLLYWRAEIQGGRGDDATTDAGRALLTNLTTIELRELADAIGAPIHRARTKPQLIDTIVNSAIGATRKYRGLSTW